MGVAARTERVSGDVLEQAHRTDAIAIGLLAFTIGVAGAGRPSLWLDEAATISASTRPLSEMADLLKSIDAVHGLYYLVMQGWFSVFPATEFWSRVPSSVLVGAAAAGVVVLGGQLSSRTVAVSAGVVFALLPRTTWAALEARSYALSMFDAVWLTVLCIVAVRRDRTWIWIGYAVVLALGVVANVFLVLVIAVHIVIVHRHARCRRTSVRWLTSVLAAVISVVPYFLLVRGQQSQVSWIWPIGPGTVGQLLGDQYFPAVIAVGAQPLNSDRKHEITPDLVSASIHAWTLVAPVIVVVLVVVVAALRSPREPNIRRVNPTRELVRVAAVWVVVPTTVIVVASLVGEPVYQPHYMAFTVPGCALLLGLCVAVVGREPHRTAVVLLALALAAIPNYLAQRGPYSKFGRDHSQVADLIETHAAIGECLSIDDHAPKVIVESLTVGRPGAFADVRDPGLLQGAVDRDELFESRRPITEWVGELRSCTALWTVTSKDASLPDHERGERLAPGARLEGAATHRVPTAAGFRIAERWQFNLAQVVKYVPPTRAR